MKFNRYTIGFLVLIGSLVSGCVSTSTEEEVSEYPRPGALSSNFNEGPHIIYEGETALVLEGVEADGRMVLEASEHQRSDLKSIQVYKSGYMPRTFEVPLRNTHEVQATYYPPAESIFAVSDIEGNFNTLVNLLQQHGIINEDMDWNFGSGHFVMVGDVFDRGNHTTEMLWLLYRLEYQASEQGGHMHLLMGNHEAMNLRGDLRYLEPKYTDFAKLAEEEAGVSFAQLYDDSSELGQWLRSKNVVERIGDKLFVHAGISPALVQSGYELEEINTLSRKMLKTTKPDFNADDSLMWGKNGPFWYRGYFDVNRESWGPKASQSEVDEALARFAAASVIVGHTHVEKPELLYEGRVCAIDVVPPADHMIYVPPVQAYGVLIQGDTYFRADEDGRLVEMEKTQSTTSEQ